MAVVGTATSLETLLSVPEGKRYKNWNIILFNNPTEHNRLNPNRVQVILSYDGVQYPLYSFSLGASDTWEKTIYQTYDDKAAIRVNPGDDGSLNYSVSVQAIA